LTDLTGGALTLNGFIGNVTTLQSVGQSVPDNPAHTVSDTDKNDYWQYGHGRRAGRRS
jgi:hypothetical protein